MALVSRTVRPRLGLGFLLALAFTGFALGPLAVPGFVGSHDGLLAVARLVELERNLADGIVLPRWSPDAFFGYGYPFFNFYAPLAYEIGALFHRLGFDLATAIELTFAFGFLVSALGTYLLARCWLSPWGALVAAVAYVYFPYHLVDAHFRGDLSEFLAMSWFPWILWALVRLRAPSWGRIAGFGVVYAALILSHNVFALVFSPVVLVFAIVQVVWRWSRHRRHAVESASGAALTEVEKSAGLKAEPAGTTTARPSGRRWFDAIPNRSQNGSRRFQRPALVVTLAAMTGILLAYGLAAFFWVPAIVEKNTVQIEHTIDDPSVDFRNHFAPDLLSRSLRQSYGRWVDGEYSYAVQAGLFQTGLALVGLVAGLGRLVRRRLPTDAATHLFVFAGLAGALWLLMQPLSTPVWATMPLMVYVQFPWRLLAPFGLATAILSGYLLPADGVKRAIEESEGSLLSAVRLGWPAPAAIAVCAVILLTSLWRLEPRLMTLPADWLTRSAQLRFEVASQAIGTTSIGEYLPDGIKIRPVTSPIAQAVVLGETAARVVPAPGSRVLVGDIQERSNRITAHVDGEGGFVVVRAPDWPGWQALLDDRPTAIVPSGQLGLIGVEVPAGSHRLDVVLGTTPIRRFASLVSALSLALLVGGFVFTVIRRGRSTKPDAHLSAWERAAGRDASKLTSRQPFGTSVTRILGVLLIMAVLLLSAAYTVWLARDVQSLNGVQHPLNATLGDAVDLLGYDLAVQPDRSIDLVLYWRARRQLSTDYHTFIHLVGITGNVWAVGDRAAGPSDRPASQWAPGIVVADRYAVRPPPGMPAGVYLIRLGLYRPDDLNRLPITNERLAGPTFPSQVVTTDSFVVPRLAEPIEPAARTTVRFQDIIRLVGFSLVPPGATTASAPPEPLPLRPGDTLPVTLYWQSTQPILDDYTVFVHLLDSQQHVVVQQDNEPGVGAYPTSVWAPGEITADPYTLKLPSDLPPGRYEIEVGLYHKPDGRRLTVDDGAGHVLGDRFVLRTAIVE